MNERLSNIGGAAGAILGKLLTITAPQLLEVILYGLIGSVIGEGIKLIMERIFKKKDEE